jgi:hypothetical protein
MRLSQGACTSARRGGQHTSDRPIALCVSACRADGSARRALVRTCGGFTTSSAAARKGAIAKLPRDGLCNGEKFGAALAARPTCCTPHVCERS